MAARVEAPRDYLSLSGRIKRATMGEDTGQEGTMDDARPPLSVLGLAGSLRQGSYNRSLLRAAMEVAPPGMAITAFDLSPLPMYNADVEAQGDPPPVAALKEALRSADAVLFATPEYNHGLPAVLKNAIDWASRPPPTSPLKDKPAAVMGATPGMGGTILAQNQLRQSFVFTQTLALMQPEVLVTRAHEKFDAQGNLTDEPTRKVLRLLLEGLAAWTLRLRGARA